MVCKKCHASLADDYITCPYCGAELKPGKAGAVAVAPTAQESAQAPKKPSVPVPPSDEVKPLIGKKYYMSSTPGMSTGVFSSKITTEVAFTEDSVTMAVKPAKFGFNGSIAYKNIEKVIKRVRPAGQYIFFSLVALVLGIIFWGDDFQVYNDIYCPTWIFFVFTVLLILRGINYGIVVTSSVPDETPLVCTCGSRKKADIMLSELQTLQNYGREIAEYEKANAPEVPETPVDEDGVPDIDAIRANAVPEAEAEEAEAEAVEAETDEAAVK